MSMRKYVEYFGKQVYENCMRDRGCCLYKRKLTELEEFYFVECLSCTGKKDGNKGKESRTSDFIE